MKRAPFTSLEDAPLVCNITITAALLDTSVRSIERFLQSGTGLAVPEPMPVVGADRKHRARKWSRFAIEAWLKGGYEAFLQTAQQQRRKQSAPARRKYFASASAPVSGARA